MTERPAAPRLPDLLMGVAALLAIPFLLWMQRATGPYLDEWLVIKETPSLSPSVLLAEFNGHLMFWAKLAVGLDEAVFGYAARGPMRVLSVASHLALVLVLYAYMRTRIDRWLALLAAVFVICAGNGWEIIGVAYSFGWMIALACGVGALLVFEREDTPRADWLACGLLVVGLLGSGVIYPFIGGIAAQAVFSERRRRALRATGLPAVLAVFYLLFESGVPATLGAGAVPGYALELLVSAFGQFFAGSQGLGAALLALAAAALAASLWRLDRLEPAQLSVLAIPLIFVLLTAITRGSLIPADASRYTFTLQVMFLLVLAEFAQGLNLNVATRVVVAALIAVAALLNLGVYADRMQDARANWAYAQSYLMAVERVGVETARHSTFAEPFISRSHIDFQYDWFELRGGQMLVPDKPRNEAQRQQVEEIQEAIRAGLR